MAKKSMVERQKKRERLVAQYAAKRASLKEIANDEAKPMEERFKARLKLAFDIDAQVPLLGSKIEKAIAGPITERFKHDMKISNKMAGDYAAS